MVWMEEGPEISKEPHIHMWTGDKGGAKEIR